MTQYQTLSIDKPGAFNTLEWFSKIIEQVNFHGRSVIDWGCGEGVMTELAIKNGALWGIGIDHERVKTRVVKDTGLLYRKSTIEDFLVKHLTCPDISILSMIIHWIDTDTLREILWRTDETAIVVWRPPDRDYKTPENGRWFPDLWELNAFMRSCGFEGGFGDVLETKPHNIYLKVFRRFKSLAVTDFGEVATKHNIYYDYEWLKGLNHLQSYLDMTHLLEGGIGYYKTIKLEGVDGFGEELFKKPWLAKQPAPLKSEQLKPFLDKMREAYEETDLMFEDMTLRDIVWDGNNCHLVDFDHIGPYDPNNPQWKELNDLDS